MGDTRQPQSTSAPNGSACNPCTARSHKCSACSTRSTPRPPKIMVSASNSNASSPTPEPCAPKSSTSHPTTVSPDPKGEPPCALTGIARPTIHHPPSHQEHPMIPQPSTQLTVLDYNSPSPTNLWEAGWGLWHVAPDQADASMLNLWYRLRDQWLSMQDSDATRRSYATGTIQWLAWLSDQNVRPWAVTTAHVRAWQSWLEAAGNAPASIGQRLSAASSWYQFVINEVHMVDGIERSAFFDANGSTRA